MFALFYTIAKNRGVFIGNLYGRIVQLCERKNITGYRLCKEIGIQPSVLTDLKSGRKKGLSATTAQKIASYLGVSVEYLLGEETKEETKLVNNDPELTEYLEILKNRPEMRMMFSLAKSATKEDVEKAVKIIEAFLSDK